LPAEAEGGACDGRRKGAETIEIRMETGFSVEARTLQDQRARQEQGHRDHERPRDAQQQLLVTEHGAPDRGRRYAEEDEHDRETGHEQGRVPGDPEKMTA